MRPKCFHLWLWPNILFSPEYCLENFTYCKLDNSLKTFSFFLGVDAFISLADPHLDSLLLQWRYQRRKARLGSSNRMMFHSLLAEIQPHEQNLPYMVWIYLFILPFHSRLALGCMTWDILWVFMQLKIFFSFQIELIQPQRRLIWTTFLQIFSHPHFRFWENVCRWCRLLKSGSEWVENHYNPA
jgi:hypothetical protein